MIDIELILITTIAAYSFHIYQEVTDDSPGVQPLTRGALTSAGIGALAGVLISLVVGYF